jgi:L-iditol 2-dehydrogenase
MNNLTKMRAAILLGMEQIEINSKTPMLSAGPGEVVVKVNTALTCGTDLNAYRRGHCLISAPCTLGHEFAGDVHELGEGVEGFSLGEPVMCVQTAPCGECHQCEMGRENLCESSHADKVQGGMAEYVRIPARVVKSGLYRKPDGITYNEAAMLNPLSSVVHGMHLVRHYRYKNVLILGSGPVGLMHLALQKRLGKRVVVAGRGGMRLEAARQMGADQTVETDIDDMAWSVMEATDGVGADLIIEAAGNKDSWEVAPRLVRKGGTIMLFGGCPPGSTACFDTARLHFDEIHLIGSFHYTPKDTGIARELLTSGGIDLKPLITGEIPLSKLQDAFDLLIAGNGIKFAIVP